MGTIADKLTYLSATKTAIKAAIVNKGVSVADTDTFRSYADKIASIETGIEEISTADAMTALLVEANVGKVYRFTGTTDNTYTNGDLYEVMQEEIADPLAGTWVFNDIVDMPSGSQYSIFNFNFSSNNNNYTRLTLEIGPAPPPISSTTIVYYNDYDAYNLEWKSDAYKTIKITSKLSEVTNGDNLLAWLQTNATKQ